MTFKFKDIGGVPSNPPAGYVGLYCNGGVLYWIDESGTTTSIASGTGDLAADGSVPLTANWDVGAFTITALGFVSDVATGTAPLTVASTTLVTNLNADKIDGADLIDEDDMVSDSDTAVPTQQSVKAYADGKVAKATFDANTILKADSDDTPAALTVGEQTLVGRITAGSITALTATQVRTLLNVEDGATADQTGAEIKAAYEAEANTNALTDARAAAVDAAIVDGDFSGSDGFMRKTGAGTYEVVKANMAATAAPTADDDSGDGYAVGSTWWDTTNDEVYLCIDATPTAAVWKQVGSGSGGGGVNALFKTGAYTASAGDIVGVGSDTAAITITLPASPSTDDYVAIWDADDNAGTNTITVGRNGNTIDGVAADFEINIDGGRVDLIYNGTTWKVAYSTPGASFVTQDTTGTTTGFTAGAGTAAKDDSTFTGNTGSTAYTVGDIVRALKINKILAD